MKKTLLILGLAWIMLMGVTGCGRKEPAATQKDEAIPVQVVTVEQGGIQEVFTTVGTVEADGKAVISSKLSGRIAQVAVELGDPVKKGQVLATLEKTDFTNERAQAKASLLQAEASLAENQANFNRMQKLWQEEAISQQEYERAKTQFAIAQTSVQQSRAGVALREEQLQNTDILAPIAGSIGSRQVNPGEMVSPGVKLMEVVDLSKVYITVQLSDSYIAQTKRGQKAQVSLASLPETVYAGTVEQISPSADAAQKTFPVRIRLENSGGIFREGMLAEVKLNFNQRQDALMVPMEAIIDEVGTKAVFVIRGRQAERKIVEPGISDGKRVEIVSGLAPGDRVVVLGQNNLEDGSKVVVK
ncbi:RND family efflux transporter MFP subunit [Hydrogenispora ethanolica]|uniref:RND family efflux transporter MFP subunit n=1 Tax=Hydrogenispora ethanolica TaxID=1082276 RepID=A0A4R1RD45_HYDET|nr:efflux RND transporter periplasmic adaptor subunit [Hydrogenispora ethanolica]TCL63753.1 RND family efflux transporter MFP subunit [Hydrogenispora ethanolica]